MIVIQGGMARYGEIWFDESPPADPRVDVLMYRQRPTPLDATRSSRFLTLVNDLTSDAKALIASFGKTNQYKIKRAEAKDELTFEFLIDPAPHVGAFCDFYDAFAQQKGLEPAYRRGVAAAARERQLVLSRASREGEAIVWHAYIACGSRAVLLHSASLFRGRHSSDRALLARANRWLHWRDMLEFKALGITGYDWGGLFEDETVTEHANVNRFKREFGGREEITYNCTVALTLRGRLFLHARGWLGRMPTSEPAA